MVWGLLQESSSLLHNLIRYSPVSITVLDLSTKLPSPERTLAAPAYLTSDGGCLLFSLQTQVLQRRAGQVLW